MTVACFMASWTSVGAAGADLCLNNGETQKFLKLRSAYPPTLRSRAVWRRSIFRHLAALAKWLRDIKARYAEATIHSSAATVAHRPQDGSDGGFGSHDPNIHSAHLRALETRGKDEASAAQALACAVEEQVQLMPRECIEL